MPRLVRGIHCIMKDSIILATSNPGKIKELRVLLAPRECTPQKELGISDADETGHTFIENALIKARHASCASGLPAIADDSGLVIPALNGAPGIYSSRFAGAGATDEDNIKKVLNQLPDSDVPIEAYFYCVIVMLLHAEDPTPSIGTGTLMGEIVRDPKGTHGFGYDPIFYVPQFECTLAELSQEKKHSISHRSSALQALNGCPGQAEALGLGVKLVTR